MRSLSGAVSRLSEAACPGVRGTVQQRGFIFHYLCEAATTSHGVASCSLVLGGGWSM